MKWTGQKRVRYGDWHAQGPGCSARADAREGQGGEGQTLHRATGAKGTTSARRAKALIADDGVHGQNTRACTETCPARGQAAMGHLT